MDRGAVNQEEESRRAGMPADRFPTTQVTLIVRLVRAGPEELREAHQHIMAVYADPLAAYFSQSRFRDLGEPVEMVAGFFADRLSRERFLVGWLESGQPLRLWLIGSFRNYCRERIRERARWRRRRDDADAAKVEQSAEHIFNQQAARAIVRRALAVVEENCEREGLRGHWHVFELRRLRDRSIRDVSVALEIPETRVIVMERTVASRMRKALRELVSWSGARADEIDVELQQLMEALR